MERLPAGMPRPEPLSKDAKRFANQIRGKSVMEIASMVGEGAETKLSLLNELSEKGDRATKDLVDEVIKYRENRP